MADLMNIDPELLRRAYGRSPLAASLQGGLEGFKSGIDIGTTLSDQKAKRKKEEMELVKEIQKLSAQRKLVKESQTPVPTDKKIAKPSFQVISPVELPSGGMVSPEGPSQNIPASLFQKSLSPEEIKTEELSKQERMKGYAAEAAPDTFAKNLLESKEDTGTGTKRFQQGTAEVNGQVLNVVFDTNTGTYRNSDGTSLEGKLVRGFKPDIRVDPTTEQLLRITSGMTQTPIGGAGVQSTGLIEFPEDLTVRQSNRLNDLGKRFEDDEIVKSSRISMQTLQNLDTVQAQGTGALIGSLQSLRARGIAGEKGVLTEKDVERTTGSPQLARRFWNVVTKLAVGKENPENIAEFKAALSAVKEAAAMRTRAVEEDFVSRAQATKELSNVSPSLIKKNISIGTQPFDIGPVVPPQYPGTKSNLTPEKEARRQELLRKKAEGTLR